MVDIGSRVRKNEKRIWTAAVIVCVLLIFHNSLTPADLSSQQSGWVLETIWKVLGWLGLDGTWVTEFMVRKTAHFTEYTVLGILLWNCIRSWRPPVRLWLAVHAWLGVLIPLTDETFQLFTDGRSGEVADVWLDAAGVCFGTVIAVVLWKILRRKRQ